MVIKRATRQDLAAIQFLMQQHGKMSVDESHLNKRDVALQARLDSGELVGFIWCGLMANNTVGYIDKFTVDVAHARKGVGQALAKELLASLTQRGVKSVFGVIRQDAYHERSAFNALRMAMGGHQLPYTYVEADLAHARKELESLGVQ